MIPKYLNKSIDVVVTDPKLMPVRVHPTDAGADLKSTKDVVIMPGDMQMIDTGVSLAIPPGYVGLVYNRSSQGKYRVSLANSVGVIDSNYRGFIKVLLVNEGEDPYNIKACDTRIAQLVITPIVLAEFNAVDALNMTERGAGGFGSTGA